MDFKTILTKKDFVFTFELVPARSSRTLEYQKIIKFLEESVKHQFFDTFSITENPGGNPSLAPFVLGNEIKKFGFDPIIHFSCKDKNRNQIESELLALDGVKLHNLLVITGDYPLYGYLGKAKPVFDLDSVQLLKFITEMEKGLEIFKDPKTKVKLPPIPFFKGCVVNPFKLTVSELWMQYFKLYRKFKAGAHFVITQSGFSSYKWLELKKILDLGLTRVLAELLEDETIYSPEDDKKFRNIPIIGSIVYPSSSLIKLLLKLEIPGILAGKNLLSAIEKAQNKEKKLLELSAKMAVILKGLGYKGVHLCVFPLNYSKLEIFMENFYKFENRWQEFLEEFDEKVQYFEGNKLKEKPLAFVFKNFTQAELVKTREKKSFFFYFSEVFHYAFFSKNVPWYPLWVKLAKFIDKHPLLKKCFTAIEYFIKSILYKCQECGDCALYEFNYVCPQQGCAKHLLNGPCGGSIDGYCEVYPFEKKCFFIKSMERAPSKKQVKKLLLPNSQFYLPPRNWALDKTSSWLNFYLERDHQGKKETKKS
jgi:methylenetetrahydrofolate reductase (NADPH)